MAKMTEADAMALLSVAVSLAGQLVRLVSSLQDVKNGLATDDPDALNAKIVAAHSEIQALDVQIQGLIDA